VSATRRGVNAACAADRLRYFAGRARA